MSYHWFISFAFALSCTLACTLPCTLGPLLALYHLCKHSPKQCTAPRYERDITKCRTLLKDSTLEQRASPNQRLVRAFGINNAFTTIDAMHAKKFVKRSKDLLATQSDEWKVISQFASNWIEQYTLDQLQSFSFLNLLQATQALVFQVVVHKFFPLVSTPSDTDITLIGSEINSLWLASKGDTCQDELKIQREKLKSKLRSTFEMSPETTEEEDNSLNILLPAYETMWRIVLRIFLEVRFRSAQQESGQYAAQFVRFCDSPTKNTFEDTIQMDDGQLVSIKGIVAEGLRLYPPTKRIYRQMETEEVAVDIEYLHRNIDEWGDDALEFVPSRWATSATEGVEKRGYIPFGAGRFECPARPHFWPFTIGILVGVLMAKFGDEYEFVDDDNELEGRQLPLDNGRDAYVGLKLRKKPV